MDQFILLFMGELPVRCFVFQCSSCGRRSKAKSVSSNLIHGACHSFKTHTRCMLTTWAHARPLFEILSSICDKFESNSLPAEKASLDSNDMSVPSSLALVFHVAAAAGSDQLQSIHYV